MSNLDSGMPATLNENSSWAKPFFIIWGGQLFSLLGSSLVQFALVWWLTQTTGSAVVLATATLAALLPEVFLAPFAGALVDRLNRRLVMIVADGSIALVTFGLVLLFWSGFIQPWHIYVAMFLRSLGSAFHWPAMQASTSLMVPDKHLSRIAGINQALRGALGIIAPPMGALLLSLIPMFGVLSVDIVTAMIAIAPLLFIAIPQPADTERAPLNSPRQLWRDVVEGARYLAGWRGALALMGSAMLLNFVLAPSSTLMPLLVTQHFHGDAWMLGWLESGMGVGAIIGGLLLGVWGGFKRRIFTSLSGIVGIGMGIAIIGLTPATLFVLALGGMALTGMMAPIANGPIQAIMQANVAPEYQGRVFSLVGSLATAMMPLSLLVAAPVAELLGVRAWFLIGGIITFVIGCGMFFVPSIREIETNRKSIQNNIAESVEPA